MEKKKILEAITWLCLLTGYTLLVTAVFGHDDPEAKSHGLIPLYYGLGAVGTIIAFWGAIINIVINRKTVTDQNDRPEKKEAES